MKVGDLFAKSKSPQITLSGVKLMEFLELGKSGEIAILSMECVTKKNGHYKISYRESNNRQCNPDRNQLAG